MRDEVKQIIIISDGTGKTAKRLMDAVLSQYSGHEGEFRLGKIYSSARTREQLDKILDEIPDGCLVIFSIISSDVWTYLHDRLHDEQILHINILEPMLSTMEKFLGLHPEYKPGLLHIIDDSYYNKIDAIGYTVEHDDGLGHQLGEADLVIIGPSRTCKTPISMYLACNEGLKVANIPIFPGDQMKKNLLKRLEGIESCRIFGVTMNPDVLVFVREDRAEFFGGSGAGKAALDAYRDRSNVQQEITYLRNLCSSQGWQVVDVTRRAIEEISNEIMHRLKADCGSARR
ncbi:MAG: pyruvate, water dikinase regulatory protein [Candidatus Zixiibacteriota bacterium]